jgi:hypothetical protein
VAEPKAFAGVTKLTALYVFSIYNVRFLIASRPICMLELQLELGSRPGLRGIKKPLPSAAGTSREWCLPCQSSAGEALSYVQGES